MEGPVLELPLELALLGHVPQGEDQPADGGLLPQIAAPDLHLDVAAVAGSDPPVLIDVLGLATAHLGQRPGDLLPLIWLDEVPQVLTVHRDVAENAAGRGGRVPDPAVVVHDQDDVGGVVHQGAEVRLAVAPDHLPGQQDPLDHQGRLPGQHLQGPGQRGQFPAAAEHGQHADQRVAGGPVLQGQRAQQDAVTPGGVPGGQQAGEGPASRDGQLSVTAAGRSGETGGSPGGAPTTRSRPSSRTASTVASG